MPQPDLSTVFREDEIASLRKHGFVIQPKADAKRWNDLRQAYEGMWRKGRFACPHYHACQAAFRQKNSGDIPDRQRGSCGDYFAAYDLLYKDKPLRVCVVSRDSGIEASDFETWTNNSTITIMRGVIRNAHWQNTLKLMNYLFFGDYSADYVHCEAYRKLFTHVRAVKCNAGKTWNVPDDMYRNCLYYLEAELRALEPTVVIAQGINHAFVNDLSSPCTCWSVSEAMKQIAGNPGKDVYKQLVTNDLGRGQAFIRKWDTSWGSCVCIGTYHPTARANYTRTGTGGLDAVLKPAIGTLRKSDFTL